MKPALYKRVLPFVEAMQWDGTYQGIADILGAFPSIETNQILFCPGRGICWKVRLRKNGDVETMQSGDFLVESEGGSFYYKMTEKAFLDTHVAAK